MPILFDKPKHGRSVSGPKEGERKRDAKNGVPSPSPPQKKKQQKTTNKQQKTIAAHYTDYVNRNKH